MYPTACPPPQTVSGCARPCSYRVVLVAAQPRFSPPTSLKQHNSRVLKDWAKRCSPLPPNPRSTGLKALAGGHTCCQQRVTEPVTQACCGSGVPAARLPATNHRRSQSTKSHRLPSRSASVDTAGTCQFRCAARRAPGRIVPPRDNVDPLASHRRVGRALDLSGSCQVQSRNRGLTVSLGCVKRDQRLWQLMAWAMLGGGDTVSAPPRVGGS